MGQGDRKNAQPARVIIFTGWKTSVVLGPDDGVAEIVAEYAQLIRGIHNDQQQSSRTWTRWLLHLPEM